MNKNHSYTLIMIPKGHQSCSWWILRTLIFHHFHDFWKVCPCFKGSRCQTEKSRIPSERASKIIIVDIEFISFHVFYHEIFWDQRAPGPLCGGSASEPPSGRPHLRPGGECFAPSHAQHPYVRIWWWSQRTKLRYQGKILCDRHVCYYHGCRDLLLNRFRLMIDFLIFHV